MIKELDINEIIADPELQPRKQYENMIIVAEYAEAMKDGDKFPPVIVFSDNGNFYLADGYHRRRAAIVAGFDKIYADVRDGGRRAALLYSVGANADHGLKRTNEDKQRAVDTLLNDPEWSSWSDRKIARKCKVSHPFVIGRRKILTGNVTSEKRKYTTKHGTTAEMDISKIRATKSGPSEKIAPQVIDKIVENELPLLDMSSNDVKRLSGMDTDLQEKVVNLIADGKAKTITDARQKAYREDVKNIKPPEGTYQVIYADPPWDYGQQLDEYGPAKRHYSTLTVKQMIEQNIPNVPDISADNAVLFLWVTAPKIKEGLNLVDVWGFDYKAMFIWDKVKHNFGHYNSVRHELLLVCTKGSFQPENLQLFDSVQTIERSSEHSEKPEKFREIIDTLYPSANKIELFARTEAEGWETWGNL